MSETAATPPQPSLWQEEVRATLHGVGAAWQMLRTRKVRTPLPRVPMDQTVELLCLFLLACGVVAGTLVLVDPLVLGLRARLPLELVRVFERVTDLGLGSVVLIPLGVAFLFLLATLRRFDPLYRRVAAAVVARLGFLILSVTGVSLFVLVVKYALGRARPSLAMTLPGPHPHLTFEFFRLKASYASFPSGHSAVVFSFAVALALLFPKARWWLIGLAVLVATSRVVLGSHYPSDVLASAALSTAFVFFMAKVFAARRLVFAVAADGTIRPKPGPSMRRLLALFSPAHRTNGSKEA
ncbi:putative phosphoesterase [Azorhizobium caulinodans ORS 571]|uniref:Putative phosphoesterase n=1 Tax=Azorhizobium caulinodans (strain ATCC 43989 / DSM 5975 / JCM 20966 / LMG 6465 / NBRC 14845 / NCIMB 13405 / ORS 571) TaxID=438753 RepID=A8HY65_AZOC5|nr:phosphatase PAP2 family protein [Azorhizobium caulinodans]BAF87579.1 putative phosphoesterase [Azorhizobium caulinodans ORS 571]